MALTATITYTKATATTQLAYNSKNKRFEEEVVTSDATMLTVGKHLVDSVLVEDTVVVSRSLNTALSDNVTVNDNVVVTTHYNISASDMVFALDTAISEYTDGPIFNDLVLNGEPFLARPVPSTAISVILS